MVRTITKNARFMINGAKLEKVVWGKAILTAVYLINLTPTNALKSSEIPYEMWHDRKPQLKYLKVFGSTVCVRNKTNKTKFDNKSWKGIIVYILWAMNQTAIKFGILNAKNVLLSETLLLARPIFLRPGLYLSLCKCLNILVMKLIIQNKCIYYKVSKY